MEYIIEPRWFYWMSIVDRVGFTSTLIAVFSGIVCMVAVIFYFCAKTEHEDDSALVVTKFLIIGLIVFIPSILIAIFIPSREILIGTKVLELATYENIALTKDSIIELVDYVINAIAQLG